MNTQEAQELLKNVLETAGFTIEDIALIEDEKGCVLNIQSDDNPMLIGRNGDVIRSLQHLMKHVYRQQGLLDDEERIRIDVDSYRSSQEEKVLSMAAQRAQRVLDSGRSVVLPPMSPFFRRLVHLHIKENFPQLATYSTGSATHRAVCIDLPEGSQEEPEQSADLYAEIEF